MGKQRTEQRIDGPHSPTGNCGAIERTRPISGYATVDEQRTEGSFSRRRFVSGTALAVTVTSLHTSRAARSSQENVATPGTPATPLPDAGTAGATPIASPGATPVATSVATGPHLEVTPSAVNFDERFDIVVTGIEPGQEVTITSRLGSAGPAWTAAATYVAPEIPYAPGVSYVDPGAITPVDGTFDVADTMAFIWAATAPESPLYYVFPQPGDIETVTITAEIGDVEIGTTSVERSIAASDEGPLYVVEDGLVGSFFLPAGSPSEPAPAVIVIGGSEGGLSPYNEATASLLASHGYAALNLAYWRIGGLPAIFENIPLEYFGTAIRWLQRQPGVDPERIAIHGTSRGGEGALLVGSYFPEIKAVVSNVGSGYVVSAPWATTPTPAWTWRGQPLQYLPWESAPLPEELTRAEIPVERIDGPVLLTGADADGLWPSSAWSQVALDRLHRYNHPWADQLLRYPGAGHVIGVPYQPVAPSLGTLVPGLMFGGDLHSNAIANANSWPAILAMLETRLMH